MQLGKLMYKYSKNLLPSSLMDIFIPNTRVHTYETRNSNNPHVTGKRLCILINSFIHQGLKYWSNIPATVKTALSVNSFKSRLKKFLLSS